MSNSPSSGRRPRPVGDAPVPELTAEAPELTKGGLLAVPGEAPLDELPGRIAPELATDGPRLWGAVGRARSADAELARVGAGGELESLAGGAGTLVGATGPEATLRAVAALGSVIWAAVRVARPRADGEEVAQLAERLALVLEAVRTAALARADGAAGASAPPRPAATPEPQRQPEPESEPEPEPEQAPAAD